MQHNVEIKVETIDWVGNFVGSIFFDNPSPSNNSPDTNKSSRKKKKKKSTEITAVKQKTHLSVLLISQGFGIVHRAFTTERLPHYQDMIKAEEDAKLNQYGLWSCEEFVKEWEAEVQKNADPTALSGTEDSNLNSLTDFSEYLDELSELPINVHGDSTAVINGENTKQLSWKPVQITGLSKPADACTLVKISQMLNSQSFPSFPSEYYPKKGIQFIDFGNEEVIDAAEYSSRLSPLPSDPLMQLPPQVKEYRLAFVQLPPDTSDRVFAERTFCDLVENQEVRLVVQYESMPCGKELVKPVLSVTLLLPVADINTSGSSVCPNNIDINESLLSNGLVFVEPIQPQLLFK
ncbi:unnamed protein product [Schistosoma turkestanicum]|nr:unnamed protein product [Schistosoma turkestanicum]